MSTFLGKLFQKKAAAPLPVASPASPGGAAAAAGDRPAAAAAQQSPPPAQRSGGGGSPAPIAVPTIPANQHVSANSGANGAAAAGGLSPAADRHSAPTALPAPPGSGRRSSSRSSNAASGSTASAAASPSPAATAAAAWAASTSAAAPGASGSVLRPQSPHSLSSVSASSSAASSRRSSEQLPAPPPAASSSSGPGGHALSPSSYSLSQRLPPHQINSPSSQHRDHAASPSTPSPQPPRSISQNQLHQQLQQQQQQSHQEESAGQGHRSPLHLTPPSTRNVSAPPADSGSSSGSVGASASAAAASSSGSLGSSPRVVVPRMSDPVQKRAVSDPLSTLLNALHLHQMLPANLNCKRGQPASDSSESDEGEGDNDCGDRLPVGDSFEHVEGVDEATMAAEALAGKIGSDVGIHRQSGMGDSSPAHTAPHNHMHLFPRPLPLSTPVPIPAFSSSPSGAASASHQSSHNNNNSSPNPLHASSSWSNSSSSSVPVAGGGGHIPSSHHHHNAADALANLTHSQASVAKLLRGAKYAGVEHLLQVASSTMPASVRTHMEKGLISYKLEQGRLAASAASSSSSAAPSPAMGQPGSARGSVHSLDSTPLHRSQSLQQTLPLHGHSATTPSSPVMHAAPAAAPASSSFFSLKSLFHSPASAHATVAAFPPPVLHQLPPSASPPNVRASSASSRSTPTPPPQSHGSAAAAAYNRSVSPLPVAASVSGASTRREGEPECSPASSGAGSDMSSATPSAGTQEEDGHWSTYASRRVKSSVTKKPSLSSGSGGAMDLMLASSSTSPEVALAQSAPLHSHDGAGAEGWPRHAMTPTFGSAHALAAAAAAAGHTTAAVAAAAGAADSTGNWSDPHDAEGLRVIEQGLSKLESASSSRGTSQQQQQASTSGSSPAPGSAASVTRTLNVPPSNASTTPGAASPASPGTAIVCATSPLPSTSSMPLSVSSTPPSLWSVPDVEVFLTSLGLGSYAPRFAASLIDGEALLELSEEDLVELGVGDKFHRRKVGKKIKAMLEAMAAAGGGTGSTSTTGGSSTTGTIAALPSPQPSTSRPSSAVASVSTATSPTLSPPAQQPKQHDARHMPHASVSGALESSNHPSATSSSSSAASRLGRNKPGGTFASLPASVSGALSSASSSSAASRRALAAAAAPFLGGIVAASDEDEEETGSGAGATFARVSESAQTAYNSDALYVNNVEVANLLRALRPYQKQLKLQQERKVQAREEQRRAADHAAAAGAGDAAPAGDSSHLSLTDHSHRSHKSHKHSHRGSSSSKRHSPQPAPVRPSDPYHNWGEEEALSVSSTRPTSVSHDQQRHGAINSTAPAASPPGSTSGQSTTTGGMGSGGTIASLPPSMFNTPSSALSALASGTSTLAQAAASPLSSSSASAASPAASPALAAPSHLTIIDLTEIVGLRHLNEGTAGVALVGSYRGERVVVKQPKKAVVGQEEWLELQLHMKLPPHPRLIPFLGICMQQQQLYFVSKFIERGSLKSLLCADASLGGDELRAYYAHPLHAIRAAVQIAEGLIHMHAHHVVHRDVSARNILVGAHGEHIVSDLGLSRWMEKRPVASSASTAAGTAVDDEDASVGGVGNGAYEDVYSMHTLTALPARWTAPEALRSQRFSERSDVYSLGVCLWEMLAGGALPYAHIRDNLQVIAGVVLGELTLDAPPAAPGAEGGGESPAMAFVRRCMLPVAQRPSMTQIRAEMQAWINEQSAEEQRTRAQQQQQQEEPQS